MEDILSKAKFLRIALSDAETPYIVPMSFGYKENVIYLHSSRKGGKIEIIKKNPRVCFEVDIETEVITANDPCKYNVRYRGPFEFEEWKVNRLCVIKIEIETMTGKENGF